MHGIPSRAHRLHGLTSSHAQCWALQAKHEAKEERFLVLELELEELEEEEEDEEDGGEEEAVGEPDMGKGRGGETKLREEKNALKKIVEYQAHNVLPKM